MPCGPSKTTSKKTPLILPRSMPDFYALGVASESCREKGGTPARLGILGSPALYEFQFWHISKVGFHLKDSKVCWENQSLGPHRSRPNYWTLQSFIFLKYKRWISTHGVKTHISTMQNSKWIIHFFFEINSTPSKYEWLPILSLWMWTGSERFLIYPKLYKQLGLQLKTP